MPTTLASIKKDLEGRIGSPIMLVAQTGRKRTNRTPRRFNRNLSFSIRC